MTDPERRPRAREAGVPVGTLEPGAHNAITDVPGVRVGHTTVIQGDSIRTGVTAVIPRPGNLLEHPVPGAVHIGNAYGKLMGSTQVEELGEIETPILLTSTLNVARAADALIDYLLAQPGNERVTSVNPLVAETSDRLLNDVRARAVGPPEVASALRDARDGLPEEGCVGGGTGAVAFGFKGGMGTASRQLPEELGGHRLGVLVQSNYGGLLTIAGAPVGFELGHRYPRAPDPRGGGSVLVVVATDAPVDARNLRRLGARSMLGIARTGAAGSNHSGDYAIAFSTRTDETPRLDNRAMDPLFWAAIEATEEGVYNSLFRATTMSGCGRTVEALPIEATLGILERHRLLRPR
jgi:D-aminopeptidase